MYITLIGLTGAFAISHSFLRLPRSDIELLLVLLGLAAVAQVQPVPLFGENSVSMAYALAFIAMLTYGPEAAVLVNIVSGIVHAVYPKRRPWSKVVFNLGALSTTAVVAGGVYLASGGSVPMAELRQDIGPAIAAGLVYFILNTGAVAVAVSLASAQPLRQVWSSNHRWLAVHYLAAALIAVAVGTMFHTNGLPGVLVSLPILAIPWIAIKSSAGRIKELQSRNAQLEQTNQNLRTAYEGLAHRFKDA